MSTKILPVHQDMATSRLQTLLYESAKRTLDVILASIGIIVCGPLLAVIALLIKLDSPGPILYRGLRTGRFGVPFQMLKFRSMVADAERRGGSCTSDEDPRITSIGRFLRKTKLDELPQMFNVLHGSMSFVGPRPEVKKFTELFTEEERCILDVRPGITDRASMWDSDEGVRLSGKPDPEEAYLTMIRPTKISLELEYVRTRSFSTDLLILFQTIWMVLQRILFQKIKLRAPLA